VVVLVVLWLSFRLLQTIISITTGQIVAAINALTEELKILSKDTTRMAGLVDNVMRHQEWCNNRQRPGSTGGDRG
jgi:ATP-dependent protease ClpP protease subunit